jgi:hypothetical protein
VPQSYDPGTNHLLILKKRGDSGCSKSRKPYESCLDVFCAAKPVQDGGVRHGRWERDIRLVLRGGRGMAAGLIEDSSEAYIEFRRMGTMGWEVWDEVEFRREIRRRGCWSDFRVAVVLAVPFPLCV